MPASALLPLTIAVSVLFVILAVIAWVRGRRGRGVQLAGVALLLPGLYLTGLLTLVWNAVTALGSWASQLVFNPAVWTGVGLLAGALLFWFIGGRWAARNAVQRAEAKASGQVRSRPAQEIPGSGQVSGSGPSASRPKPAKKGRAPASTGDPEMDEIEALLRSRGIE